MEQITAYQILETLYKTEKTSIFLALNDKGEKIAIKTPTSAFPTLAELKRFETEFAISSNVQGDGILKVFALLPQSNTVAIVSEYVEHPTLGNFLKNSGEITVEEALQIAINIAKTLEAIHQKNVIHKDINANNILIDPQTLKTIIIDFDIATQLSVEKKEIVNINHLEGSLLYISPEQTGRMNRNIDYRTDLYSLGVLLYEMLTGELPFKSQEKMELIHAHIALMPQPPHFINKEIPKIISEIVLKLLAKNAEDRYQSAKGLHNDLATCLSYLIEKEDEVEYHIELGKIDYTDKFHIPQKLYGREEECIKLLQTFDEVCREGVAKIMLIKGYSGIGKSALIQEIQKPITKQKGYYIKGKFEQFQRNIPYSAIIQAFDVLIDTILTESNAQLYVWKNSLLEALDGNGEVITEVIPRLELIIGKQEEVEKLPPTETQNRFNYIFERFIKVFTQKKHPIALVIDDLQWADSASLQLIDLFLKNAQNQYLFIIASYRDNEVDEVHPLTLMLKDLENYTNIESISLKNLTVQHIQSILVDTLKTTHEATTTLAQLIFDKTQGNPFFVNQFLITLYEDKLLTFDYNAYKWQWNDDKIKAKNITDNVVELLVNKIEKLPEETVKLLQFAAAFNTKFNTAILKDIADIDSEENVEKYLIYALEEQLILTTTRGYRFQHDRIQQASYSLIEAKDLASVHLKIGQTLLKNNVGEQLDKEIFNVVNQLNRAKELITDEENITSLKNLNFQAAIKAKNANAYVSALDYLYKTLALTSDNMWQTEYTFALQLHEELMQMEYLNGYFENSEKYAQIALENAKNVLEKANIYNILIVQSTLQAQYADAISFGKKALSLLDFIVPDDANLEAGIGAGIGAVMQNLGGRNILDLVHAVDAEDQRDILVAKILVNMAAPAYLSNPNLWTFVIVNATALGLEKGNVPELCTAYSSYGILSGIIFGDYLSGSQYGEFAYKLSEKYNNLGQKSNTCFVAGTFLTYTTKPAKDALPIYKEGVQIGLQAGELQFAAYNAMNMPFLSFLQGDSSDKILNYYEESLQIVSKYKNIMGIDIVLSNYVLLKELTNLEIPNFKNLPTTFEDILAQAQANNSFVGVFNNYLFKSVVSLVMQSYEDALQNIGIAQNFLPFMVGTMQVFFFHLYQSVIKIRAVEAGFTNKDEVLEQIKDGLSVLQKMNELNPANFANKYHFLQAEIAQLEGHYLEAMNLYDLAIEESRKNEFVFENALVTEGAALFYEKINKPKIAQIYWQEAYQAYSIWGASKKLEQLQKKYNFLLKAKTSYQANSTLKSVTQTSMSPKSTESVSNELDFVTLLKASQMLSEEVVLDALLEKMMKILIENSGAQRGFLFLHRGDKPHLEAAVDVSNEKISILQSMPLEDIKESELLLSTEIVNYVLHTQKIVVLDDAMHVGQFINIPYINKQQVKSLLCMPMLKTGKMVGILYLENNLSIGSFTKEHLEVLNVLSTQMAISVENALLYENLEDKVEQRTLQLNEAYQQIKVKNENITHSINYGQRIQDAILPNPQVIKESLKNHFILFRPRDIVSGDFYWFTEKDDKVVIAAIDCTGHGVPGAFMSMIGYTLLSEIISAKNIFSPSLILKIMDDGIHKMLKQSETQNRDGMDLALCVWEKSEHILHFAGAKNPLVYIKNNEMFVISGNKLGIGGETRRGEVIFEEHTVLIDTPTCFYIYSDGYQDQFGGQFNKKFMKSKLKEMLFEIHQQDFELQKDIANKRIEQWMGNTHQTDDILLIGFKLE
jgi:predicted ATPase/serine phosphatase RsbU (regulator of sigma subunit)/tRNA A-37 threonylcarbamoyl transferase component Bud32